MKGRNDNAHIVNEVVVRDPVTLYQYRVEIEYGTQYTSAIRIKFDGQPEILIGIYNGEVKVNGDPLTSQTGNDNLGRD